MIRNRYVSTAWGAMPESWSHGLALPGRLPLVLTVVLMLGSGCAMVAGGGDELRDPDAPAPVATLEEIARQHITAHAIDGHVEFLASERTRSRNGFTARLDRDAAWVARRLHLAGLAPAGDDGGFIQYWPYERDGDMVRAANVVAVVPGSDPALAGEHVVVMARFGGVGGAMSDSDDATETYDPTDRGRVGIAALVEVAAAFAALPAAPARSVVFVVASGSEAAQTSARGGWRDGARWFLQRTEEGGSRAVAAIGIGAIVGSETDAVDMLVEDHGGSTEARLLSRIAEETPRLGLRVIAAGERPATRPSPATSTGASTGAVARAIPASDDLSRNGRDVPGVWVSTAVPGEAEGAGARTLARHRADLDACARVAQLVFLAVHRLASERELPAGLREAGR